MLKIIVEDRVSLSFLLRTFLMLLVLFFPLGLMADTLFLKNGKTIEGKLQGATGNHWKIILRDGRVENIPEEDIKDVKITSQDKEDKDVQTPKQDKDKKDVQTPKQDKDEKDVQSPKQDKDKKDVQSPKQDKEDEPPRAKGTSSSLTYRFLMALGYGQIQFNDDKPIEVQPPSEFGLGSATGETQLEYPNLHSGLMLQAAAKVEIPIRPATAIDLGVDLNLLLNSKADSPIKIETSFTTSGGDMEEVKTVTEQSYSYNYLSAMAGLSSYFQTLDLHLSYYLRFVLGGSYSLKEKSERELSFPSTSMENTTSEEKKGSISGRPLGLGFALQKRGLFHLGKVPINLNLLCSIDSLSLKGKEEEEESPGDPYLLRSRA